MLRNRFLSAILQQPALRPWTAQSTPSLLKRIYPSQPGKHLGRSFSFTRGAPRPYRTQQQLWRLRSSRNTRYNSTKHAPAEAGSKPAQSVSSRFKELSRKYGWAAVGVYLGLSALDFPFCFLAVRLVGPDRIGEAEHAVVHGFWTLVSYVAPSMAPDAKASTEATAEGTEQVTGTEVKQHKLKENASIWTQLLLAYGVHKSLIFFRVPLTAAVTPKVVKTLRGWGWNIGPRVKPAR